MLNVRNVTGLSDVMFKAMMLTKENILSKLLETLYKEKTGRIFYLNAELPVRRFIEKGKRLDLYLEATDSYVDIEVTNDYNVFIINRNLGFGFQMYCDTVKKGDTYDMYKKVHAIQLIGNKKSDKNIKNCLIKDEDGNVLSDKLLYSEIYIDNFVSMYYNKDVKNIKKYKYIIMLGLNLEELTKFNLEYGDEIVNEYTEKFKELLITEFEPLLSKEEDERKIRNTIASTNYKDGIEQGQQEEKIEIAKKLLKQNVSVEIISSCTGLSIEEINDLKEFE